MAVEIIAGRKRRNRLDHLALMTSMVLMGTAYVGAKFALQTTGPYTTAFFRFLITSLITWPIIVLLKAYQPIQKADIGYLIGHAAFQTTFYFALQYMGLQYTTASNTALIVNTRPIILALIAVIFLKERFSTLQWAAMFFSFLGVLVILQDPLVNTMPNHIFGDSLILLNAVSGAMGIVFAKRLLARYEPFTILVYQCTIGMIGLFPLAMFETGGHLLSGPIAWGPIVFLAIFCTVLAQGLLNVGLVRLPVSTTGAYFFVIPVLNVVFAATLLNEPLTWSLAIGGMMIVTGTYLITTNKQLGKTTSVNP